MFVFNLAHETFIRFALAMKRSPAPLFFNTGGFPPEKCMDKFDQSEKIFTNYAKWGVNAVCLQGGLKQLGYVGKKWGAVGDGP